MQRWCRNAREVGCGGREGAAATVVLAHGYGVNQASWEKLLPSISHANNKVLLFDWDFTAGGGGDDVDEAPSAGGEKESRYTFGRFAEDLIVLMDEREVRGAVFVGHSMSAMVGCIASARRPDLFAHLVLLCASPRYINSREEGYVGGFEEAGVHAMLAAMESDFHAWVKGFVPNAAGGSHAPQDVVDLLEQSFLAMDPAVALRLARMIFLGDQRAALDAVPVAVPCTVVQVLEDFVAPPAVAEYMRRRMTSTRTAAADAAAAVAVVIIESVGHFPQLVAPRQVVDILNSVLLPNEDEGAATAAAQDVDVDVPPSTSPRREGI